VPLIVLPVIRPAKVSVTLMSMALVLKLHAT
jgi:hypothetical protein